MPSRTITLTFHPTVRQLAMLERLEGGLAEPPHQQEQRNGHDKDIRILVTGGRPKDFTPH